MQRYFVPIEGWHDNQIVKLSDNDVHHISRVMRMELGNKIICCHPEGKAAVCEITEITNDFITCCIVKWLNEEKEFPIEVTIVQGIPKGDKLEYIIQKGTELGATAFIPYQAARSIVKWDNKKADKKINRLEKIAKEASEQSHRTKIPKIESLHSFKEILYSEEEYDVKLFAYEEEAKVVNPQHSLKSAIKSIKKNNKVMMVIGPEGGFSTDEADQLKLKGFKSVRLGPRILRTETAPLYFLSALSYEIEEME